MACEYYMYTEAATETQPLMPLLVSIDALGQSCRDLVNGGRTCEDVYMNYFLPIISGPQDGTAENPVIVPTGWILDPSSIQINPKPTMPASGDYFVTVDVDGVRVANFIFSYEPPPVIGPYPLVNRTDDILNPAPPVMVNADMGGVVPNSVTLAVTKIRSQNPNALFICLVPFCAPARVKVPEKFPVINGIFIEENNYCNPCC